MEENSIDNDLNHNKKASITRYSSDLVKRSIDDLEKIHTGFFPLIRKPKILIVVDLDFGKFLKGILRDLDYELNTIEAYGQLDVIYLELSRTQYEIVILTNTTLTATHIIPVVPEIKKRFPSIRIIVISGDVREDYIKELYDLKIESFLKIPFEVSYLKQIISKETFTENTPS
jgi:DNA-binding NtrC family response regulator